MTSLLSKIKLLDPFTEFVSQAKNYDPWAANELLKESISCFRAGKPLPKELAHWLANALEEITNGKDPSKALGIKIDKRKERKFSEDMELMIAECVHRHPQGKHKAESQDEKLGAYAACAEEFSTSPNTVEKIYKRYEDGLKIQEEIEREANET